MRSPLALAIALTTAACGASATPPPAAPDAPPSYVAPRRDEPHATVRMTSLVHLPNDQELSETVQIQGDDYPPPDNFGRSQYRLRIPVGRTRWRHRSVVTRGYTSADSYDTRAILTCHSIGGDRRSFPCSVPVTRSYPVQRTGLEFICIADLTIDARPGDRIELRHDIFPTGRCVLQCAIYQPDGTLTACPQSLSEGTVRR